MPQKIRRRSHVFHKRNTAPIKIIVTVVAAAGLITAGYFAAKFVMEKGPAVSSPDSRTSSSQAAVQPPASSTVSQPAGDDKQPDVPTGSLRAFYIPVSLLRDTAALDTQLDAAKAAGFNAVLFDLKDANGVLHYTSSAELAVRANSAAAGAMTVGELTAAGAHIREKGLTPIPRLYAFKDPLAPRALPDAKVTLESNPGYTWYDDDPSAGGKPWLNPYAPEAHRYITGLAEELAGGGFTVVMLDGVQFPDRTSRAYYGTSELTSLSKSDVLEKFVTDLSAAVEGTRVLLCAPGLAIFGDGTAPFGGNPLSFGAADVAPVLLPSTLGKRLTVGEETVTDLAANPAQTVALAARQIHLRMQLMEAAQRPGIMPWLQAQSYTAQQIHGEIAGVTAAFGEDASYILYHPDGTYDFASLANS